MDLLEILLALALWLLFAFLGWRKKAVRREVASAEPGDLEMEFEDEQAPDHGGEPRGAPIDFRDLIRQLREGWMPPEVSEEPQPMVTSTPLETPPPPDLEELPEAEPAPQRPLPAPPRRKTRLARRVMEDLTSGRASLARAIVLREVLGPPVALRGSQTSGGPDLER